MKKNTFTLVIILTLTNLTLAQSFGDSYYSVKAKVSNIISSVPNGNIEGLWSNDLE